MLGYLFADIIHSDKQTVFQERSLRKTEFQGTDNFEGKISEHIFKAKGRVLSYPSSIFCNTQLTILGSGEHHQIFPSFSWASFIHMMCLTQLHTSKNIWWITIGHIIVFCKKQQEKWKCTSTINVNQWLVQVKATYWHICYKTEVTWQ